MPPGTHAPIKKYNYERSLFRWVMSRHPEPFEAHGISTKTLERAPLAREAFYTSNWPGAKVLVHCSHDNKYERTSFFDAIIERGLRDGTRFNVDHVTSDERSKLGITMDRASGKYYLHAYGSARSRRNSSARRGSATSSEGDPDQHPIIRELGDLIHSEIEAAGENADVSYEKSRREPGSAPGSTVLTFSVTIQPRDAAGDGGGDGDSGDDSGRRTASPEGAGAGAAAADAGGGNPTGAGTGMGATQQHGRPAGNASSLEARLQQQQQQRQQQQQPRQRQPSGSNNRDSSTVAAAAAALASVAQGGKKLNGRGRPRQNLTSSLNSASSMSGAGGGGGDGSGAAQDAGADAEEPSKRHKSVSSITRIFPFPNNMGALGIAKTEPVQQMAGFPGGGGGDGGPSRMDTSYRPTSLRSSHSSASTTSSSGGGSSSFRGRPQPKQQPQPAIAFAGGGNNGSRSFLPGMDGSIPQPLPLLASFQAGVGAASSSSPSSGSSSSCSSPQQYGAGAGSSAGGGGAQRPQPPPADTWNLPYFDSHEQHPARASDGAMSGIGGMGNVGEVMGEPEAGGGSNTPCDAAEARLGGGAHLPPVSLGVGSGSAGYPTTLLDHRPASSQSRPQSQDVVALTPCAPYTTQQSLSRQAANGGRGAQAGWGGGGAAVVRTAAGGGLPSVPAARAGGVSDPHDKEFDFLEVFF